jgi:hypothetical protein
VQDKWHVNVASVKMGFGSDICKSGKLEEEIHETRTAMKVTPLLPLVAILVAD